MKYPRVQVARLKAMVWISEIESAKSSADLKTGAKVQTNFEVILK